MTSNTNKDDSDNVKNPILKFVNPDTGGEMIVPINKIIVGGLDYNTINKHPYVYDQKNGYISVADDKDIFMIRLQPNQIMAIEAFLKRTNGCT